MIYVLYSGDYEVFMGGNYLPESEILIEPTRLAMDAFESIGVPVTFFADLLCLWRYRELGFGKFPDQMDNQLKHAVQRGHDVQMHIHPHWTITDIELREDGSTHYHFDNTWIHLGPHIPDLYGFVLKHLLKGKEYLNHLLGEIVPDYRCVAFRAGGYGIVHGTEDILAALEDAGYLIDSSVVPDYPGIDVQSVWVSFDNVPRRGNYCLSRRGGLTKPVEAGVFEIPVGAAVVHELGSLLRMKARAIRRRLFRRQLPHVNLGYTAGERIRREQPAIRSSLSNRLKRMITRTLSMSHWGMLDITEDVGAMLDITQSYVRRYRDESPDLFFSVSFHPKEFVVDRREALKKYHQELKNIYGNNIRAITFREAADLIPHQLKDLST